MRNMKCVVHKTQTSSSLTSIRIYTAYNSMYKKSTNMNTNSRKKMKMMKKLRELIKGKTQIIMIEKCKGMKLKFKIIF